MEWIERPDFWLQLKDDGKYTRHYTKFPDNGGTKIRLDKDPVTGEKIVAIFKQRGLIVSNKTTGEIQGTPDQSFNVEHELLGPGDHPDPLLEYVQAVLPDDFTQEVSVDVIEVNQAGTEFPLSEKETVTRTAYKVVAGKLVKLTAAELNAPIKRDKP